MRWTDLLPFQQAVRKSFGGKAIEENAGLEAEEKGRQVEDFFVITEKELEMKRTEIKQGKDGKNTKKVETYMTTKSICHVENTSDYVNHLIKQRGLDPNKTLVRIGLDGGGGSLKIMVSIFDPSTTGEVSEDWMNIDRDDRCTFSESIAF